MNTVEIPLSKTKTALVALGAVAFVVAGILFIITPDTFISPIFRNVLTIRLTGIAAVLFFGGVGIYGFRKLSDKTAGLIIDDSGITDNTNAASVGLIDWEDITGIEIEQVMSTRFLLIFTSDPDKYLNRVNGFKRKLMQGNNKMYGTPLSITSTTLKYDIDDLARLIQSGLTEQHAKRQTAEKVQTIGGNL